MSCGSKGREWFQNKLCSIPQDDALIAELTTPTYTFTSTGKMVVEANTGMRRLVRQLLSDIKETIERI
jgi:hypothetical protein